MNPNDPRRVDNRDLYCTYQLGTSTDEETATDPARLFARVYLVPALSEFQRRPVLELGAGTGMTILALRSEGFLDVHGVDSSPAQVEVAHRKGIDVELIDGRTALKRANPRSLGGVLALDVLEHLTLEEQVEWVRLIDDRLMDGGVFVARVPNGAGLFGGTIRYGDITHRTAFTVFSIKQLLHFQGFQQVSVRPCRPIAHGLLSAARLLLWRGIELGLLLANMAESGQTRDVVFTRNLFVTSRHGG